MLHMELVSVEQNMPEASEKEKKHSQRLCNTQYLIPHYILKNKAQFIANRVPMEKMDPFHTQQKQINYAK